MAFVAGHMGYEANGSESQYDRSFMEVCPVAISSDMV
jgi:hypothetical protein